MDNRMDAVLRLNNLRDKKESNHDFFMILLCLNESYGLSDTSFNEVKKSLDSFNESIDNEINQIKENL